jgi:hypothetical protein
MRHLLPPLEQIEQELRITQEMIRDTEIDLENLRRQERVLNLLRQAFETANS